ncbi:hypothetical protein CPC08DRAFT_320114 [Agrocybe pediades]|nr:hypothetical protein CPC08DRAFT_320114 [Agrocybe pediades]
MEGNSYNMNCSLLLLSLLYNSRHLLECRHTSGLYPKPFGSTLALVAGICLFPNLLAKEDINSAELQDTKHMLSCTCIGVLSSS